MGEMADMYIESEWLFGAFEDEPGGYGRDNRFDEFRDNEWRCKDGTTIKIRDMSFSHLLNAYKVFGDERFRDEMLIRMFEQMANPKVRL